MKLHMVIYAFWASYWLSEGNACGSLICHLWGKPLIAHLRDMTDVLHFRESKLDSVHFSVAFSLTLRKPRREETTARSASFIRWCQGKKNYHRHRQFTNISCPTAKTCWYYNDSLGVGCRCRHGACILKPTILRRSFRTPCRWQAPSNKE